jgi:hypothetical protein
MLFSRLTYPEGISGVIELPERDEYLAQMLKRNSTPTEMPARTSNRAEKTAFFMELPLTVFISSCRVPSSADK